MCSTHDINCFKCGKRIAWYSMFDNIQSEDEYECSAVIKEKTNEIIMDKVIQDNSTLLKLKEILQLKGLYTPSKFTYCHIGNETTFCKTCAKKLKYICPICGGTIWLSRSR